MELAITAVVAAAIAGGIAWLARGRSRNQGNSAAVAAEAPVETRRVPGEPRGGQGKETAPGEGVEEFARLRKEVEHELRERRAELVRLEERALQRQESLEARLEELARRDRSLVDRERNLDRLKDDLREAKQEHLRELERIARLTQSQAKQ